MVSVIIPTYNSAKLLSEALDSVRGQTLKDLEIIVIDDGSTDDTEELVRQNYPEAKYLWLEHCGVSAARNRGIREAQGELIAFLDADDTWLPTKLERQVALFEKHSDVSMIFTENFFFGSRQSPNCPFLKKQTLMRGDLVRNIFLYSYIVTSTVAVRKAVFENVGFFDEALVIAEDDNMWMRIALMHKVVLVNEPLTMYRITDGSLSSRGEDIYNGVSAHISLIKNKYPQLYKKIGTATLRKKYSQLTFSRGYHSFWNGERKAGRNCFITSFIYDPLHIRALIYIFITFLPFTLVNTLKQITVR